MFGAYRYISSRLAKGGLFSQSQVAESKPQSFTLFSSLPPELRRRIWFYALPERLIGAFLQNNESGYWVCCRIKAREKSELRSLPVLFSVCVESREFCLEHFVPFANTFIHPTLDLLCISWLPYDALFMQPKMVPIPNQPLGKLHAVAITLGRHAKFDSRFGALVNCLVQLGVPDKLYLTLNGARVPHLYSDIFGFSISNGESLTLLNWPKDFEESTAEAYKSPLSSALVEQKEKTPGFKIPELGKGILQIYSGPR